jgi:putative tricarboxylic transport membrane protein
MEPVASNKGKGYLIVGGIGLLVAIGYMVMALRLPFGRLSQPGAGVFPVFVGIVLIVGSLLTIREGWSAGGRETIEFPGGPDRLRVIGLVVLLLAFFAALPWLGQLVSSALFCVFLMRMLSKLPWIRIVAYAVAIAVLIDVVFEIALKVPLPRGVLGF